jgi:glycosyltransferase involved in cell wall biosynthesis
VVEAAANGCPVLASDCTAHCELLTAEDRFSPHDATALRALLEAVVFSSEARETMRRRQADLRQRFSVEAVGTRFWNQLSRLWTHRSPRVARNRRPSIAFLSPLPPARSGVADYSYATLGPLAARAEVSVFSETAGATAPESVASVGRPDVTALLDVKFDAVVSVIGNSDFHLREFDLLLRFGSSCIAHDARMLGFYRILLGMPRACAAASDELGRPVSENEIGGWLTDERGLKALFLGEIAATSRPMIVHSPVTQRLVKERHGVDCVLLPFVPYRSFGAAELAPPARAAARRALGVGEHEIIVASFGMIDRVKCIAECIWAIEILRSWGVPARLVLVGTGGPNVKWLRPLAAELGLGECLTVYQGAVPDHIYRLWLAAADVGVQLRAYQLGGLSGALLDCIAAALPTVSTQHLTEVADAPSYVVPVPDQISPVLVAERIMEILDTGTHLQRPLAERDAVLAVRNFENYADRLLQALGLE